MEKNLFGDGEIRVSLELSLFENLNSLRERESVSRTVFLTERNTYTFVLLSFRQESSDIFTESLTVSNSLTLPSLQLEKKEERSNPRIWKNRKIVSPYFFARCSSRMRNTYTRACERKSTCPKIQHGRPVEIRWRTTKE